MASAATTATIASTLRNARHRFWYEIRLVWGCVSLSFLFRRLRDGEGFNRHFNSLIFGSYDLQQFGPVALGVCVVYKRSECYERASFGVSLCHPMEEP